MKTLMLSTALATAVAFSAAAQTAVDTGSDMAASTETVPAFLAGDVIGKSLHTLDSDTAAELGVGGASADRDSLRWTSSDEFLADRDDWRDVGTIDDIVMTADGETRGVLVDIGGFLGFGARTVMIDIGDVFFVTEDPEAAEPGDFHMVVAMSNDQLEGMPEFDEEMLRAGFEGRPRGDAGAEPEGWDDAAAADDAGSDMGTDMGTDSAGSGDVMGDGFAALPDGERTADRLIGADVYDAEGENVGTVDDVVLGPDDRITDVIVDVGGFLGIGAHSVALPLHDATIGWHEEDDEVRVQVSMTGETLEAMPEYEG